MAEYKGKLLKGLLTKATKCLLSDGQTSVEDIIPKSYTVSGTTNSNGNYFTTLRGDYAILGVRVTAPTDHYIIPYYSPQTNQWALRLKKWDDTTQANILFDATIIATHQ